MNFYPDYYMHNVAYSIRTVPVSKSTQIIQTFFKMGKGIDAWAGWLVDDLHTHQMNG